MSNDKYDSDSKMNPDHNPDAITGAPGSHPIGTGVGAAAAGAAGMAIGSAIPGIGTAVGGAVGAVIGAVAGGLAGKGVAEAVDPTVENAYWRDEHRNRTYYDPALDYDRDFAPAYRYGWESFSLYGHRSAEEIENQLQVHWEKYRGDSRLKWDRASLAVRDAWDRLRAASEKREKSDR